MSELIISGLQAEVAGREILHGVDLVVRSGEVHAVMGPNGSGKSTLSHVLMGRPGYTVTGGSVTLDGEDLLALPAWERAQRGLFLAMQYPTEVPGVRVRDVLAESRIAGGSDPSEVGAELEAEADRIGLAVDLLDRPLNVDLSGGEKKRLETAQLAVLAPRFAILDEIDSGLDVDALRDVSRRVMAAATEGLGVLAITHYARLLEELRPDVVHIFARGRVLESGDASLADRLEAEGYAAWLGDSAAGTGSAAAGEADPAHPVDPFADPLA